MAKREIKSSDFDFREEAFSTRSRIFETVDSPNSRESGGVQGRGTLYHDAIDRYFFARLDDDDRTDPHLVRVYLLQSAVPLHIGVVGADVHQVGDVPAAFAHGVRLEPLAHLVKQHHRDGFQVIAVFIDSQRQCAQGGYRH